MNEDEKLHSLFKTHFEREMEYNPIYATFLGYKHDKYDHLLPNGSIKAKEEQIIRILQQKRDLDTTINYELLSEEGKLDYDLLQYFINNTYFQNNELASWKGGIDSVLGASPIGLLGFAIYYLYVRDYAPLKVRVGAIIERLKTIPRFLDETKSLWLFPVELWVNLTLEEGPRTIGFMQLIQSTLEPNLEPNQHQELLKAIDIASEAINKYMSWLEKEILPKANHKWAIGSQKFTRLLEIRKLPKSPEEILKVGEKTLKDTKKELEKLTVE
ncbi:MAG: DUF885 family protein, partial [Candidatus Hodarchaeota archaeon]